MAKVLLAQIGAPQGLKGEVRVKPFGEPQMLNQYGKLETGQGRKLKITRMRDHKGTMLVVKFEGVNTREEADALNGTELFIERAKLPTPEEDEFYVSDLIGMEVVNDDCVPLGQIRDVPNFGAGDMLEIEPVTGRQSYLVPFTKHTAPKIDFEKRMLTLIPPAEVLGDREKT